MCKVSAKKEATKSQDKVNINIVTSYVPLFRPTPLHELSAPAVHGKIILFKIRHVQNRIVLMFAFEGENWKHGNIKKFHVTINLVEWSGDWKAIIKRWQYEKRYTEKHEQIFPNGFAYLFLTKVIRKEHKFLPILGGVVTCILEDV